MPGSAPWILGIASSHNGAACLLHGPELVVAIQEERLLRQKRAEHPARFPSLSVAYCLGQAGIAAKQLDAVVLCTATSMKNKADDIYLNGQLQVIKNGIKVFFIPHHFGHAVAVYALSGMRSCSVLVVDGNGSPWDELLETERKVILPAQLAAVTHPGRTIARENISLYKAKKGTITPIEKHINSYEKAPSKTVGMEEFQSLGDMYGCVGQQIFGSFLEGPGKVMGLAPYGKPTIPVEEFYRVKNLGFEYQDAVRKRFLHNDRWPERQEEYSNLAASVQKALEEAVLSLCSRLKGVNENLCYAGGVALNSVANERIVREAGFRNVFIMPAAEDSGTAIGAAYYGLWQLCGYSTTPQQQLDNMGHTYNEAEIVGSIQRMPGLLSSRKSDVVEETADLLSQGKIVGWLQGGAELGPRALGQRSILCDPRNPDMKDILNRKVKFREGFRPFAPMILEEDVCEWFDVDSPYSISPFMLRVLPFRSSHAARVPAVVHVDGTGRVQTVSQKASPDLHRLLTAFKSKTGIPILLNTSFNIAGEPIVETPLDALWCFLYTAMDACVMGNYIVSKEQGRDCVLDHPISIRAQSFSMYTDQVNEGVHFSSSPPHEAGNLALSGHISRIEDLNSIAQTWPWLRLFILAKTPWGDVINGVPGGLVNILRLINGDRTGREIYELLIAEGGYSRNSAARNGGPSYPLLQFRQHIGLLRRIGAIRFNLEAKAQAVAV